MSKVRTHFHDTLRGVDKEIVQAIVSSIHLICLESHLRTQRNHQAYVEHSGGTYIATGSAECGSNTTVRIWASSYTLSQSAAPAPPDTQTEADGKERASQDQNQLSIPAPAAPRSFPLESIIMSYMTYAVGVLVLGVAFSLWNYMDMGKVCYYSLDHSTA